MNEGHIFIDDVITPDTLSYVKQKLTDYAAFPNIVLHIQSPGGSVYAGYNIYHTLKNSGKHIRAIIEGEAQSMATFIPLAADVIEICNPSVFMIHMPSSGIQGTAEQFEQGASELRSIENDMVNAYAMKTKLPPEQIREMMRKETRMNAAEAQRMGFVDTVLNSYQSAVALGKSTKMKDKKTPVAKLFSAVAEFISGESSSAPVAVDLATTDGKMLHVESEDGVLMGKPATIDGQPATGTYTLADGRTVRCENGMVVDEQMAKAPAPPVQQPAPAQAAPVVPVQSAQPSVAELEAQLAAAKQAAAAAEAKVLEGATALAKTQEEVEKLKKKTVGDDTPPAEGLLPDKSPKAMGPTAAAQERNRTMQFLMKEMSWLAQYYPESEIANFARGPQAASILETNFNYTWNGILTTDIFYKPTQTAPALADLFTIDQDIKSHKQYNLVTQLNKIVKPYTGCDRTFNGNRQLITNTTVRTKEFQVSESWCKDDFTGYLTGAYNLLAQEWLKTGIESFDPSGTPINRVVDKLLSEAIARDIFRRVSFAAGNSSDDDYNQIDGLWDRLIDSSGASNYCVRRSGTSLGTGTLSSGQALTILEAAYADSNILLKEIIDGGGGTFWVTRSIWDNLYNSYIGTGAVTEAAFADLKKGIRTLTYKGIPVRPVGLWDTFLAESDNPLYATTRHLVLLTVPQNHILGVENGADLNKLEGWYERKDRKFYWEADFKLGYNYLHCDLQTIAY